MKPLTHPKKTDDEPQSANSPKTDDRRERASESNADESNEKIAIETNRTAWRMPIRGDLLALLLLCLILIASQCRDEPLERRR